MARKTEKQLEKLKKKYNVSKLWSWSKYNSIKTDLYSYYLKYIKMVKEDRADSIYGVSGGKCHDIIESFYNNKIKFEDMIDEYESALKTFKKKKLKYNRTDEDMNKKIAKKYEDCMKHFFKNHTIIKEKILLEKFIIIKIGNFIFQGYLDAIHKENRGGRDKIVITDWKSSSLYTGNKIEKERGQLVLYAEGIRQKGFPLEDIIIRWNFLKYVNVDYMLSNGSTKQRIIERNQIGAKLLPNIKMWLKKMDRYTDDEIEDLLSMVRISNSIDDLPINIRDKFKITDCYVEIPLNEDIINDLKNDIILSIVDITKRENEYNKSNDENIFWEDIDDHKSYFMANLSGYSRELHKPYDEYLYDIEIFIKKRNNNEDMSWIESLEL